jgi:uncharacterized lipoprotein NlpE involved in copper resistance
MRYATVAAIIVTIFALTAALYGCKKKEEVAPTAETAAETGAAVLEEEIVCPAPGEDPICNKCKILFQGENKEADFVAHMEEKHPERWAVIQEEFYETRKGEEGAETTQ